MDDANKNPIPAESDRPASLPIQPRPGNGTKPPKKPYNTPVLTDLGSVKDLSRSGVGSKKENLGGKKP
jgi:hypothetical protein